MRILSVDLWDLVVLDRISASNFTQTKCVGYVTSRE